jgi:hypothetical protein
MNRHLVESYKQRIAEQFPTAHCVAEIIHPENPNGLWLEYEVHDELVAAELGEFAATLSMEMIIDHHTDITLIPLALEHSHKYLDEDPVSLLL